MDLDIKRVLFAVVPLGSTSATASQLVFRYNNLLATYFLFGQQTGAKNQPGFPVNWDDAINA